MSMTCYVDAAACTLRSHLCAHLVGARHSFVIRQYLESSFLELTIHSFFVQLPLLLLLESCGQRPPQKVPTHSALSR
jgi:hypothetical protein